MLSMEQSQQSYVKTVALIVAIIIIALAIGSFSMKAARRTAPTTPTGARQMLLKHPFTMVRFTDAKGSHDVKANKFEIGFGTDKVSGVICNSFSGGYTLTDGQTIQAEQVVSTKKACEASIMDVESAFFDGLRAGMTIQSDANGDLVLTSKDGNSFQLVAKE